MLEAAKCSRRGAESSPDAYHWHGLEKLVRRNRLVAGATTGIALALLVGTIVGTEQAIRARHAGWEQARLRDEAQADALKDAEVAQFLKMILQGAQPSAAMGRNTTTLREILDRAAMRLRRDLTNQPEIRAELFSTLAQTYHDLGLYEKMDAMARESLACLPPGIKSMAAVRALAQIGDASAHLGKLEEAARFIDEALQMRRQLPVEGEPDLSGLSNNLELVRREQGSESDLEATAAYRKLPETNHAEVTVRQENLANDLSQEGKPAEASDLKREAQPFRSTPAN